jgi:hypothetical protein
MQADRQTDRQADKQANRQASSQASRQTVRQTEKMECLGTQTNRVEIHQTDIQIDERGKRKAVSVLALV